MTVNFGSQKFQRGATLIEAMIGTLLLSILLLGMSYALSRTLLSQRYMNAQNLAILEIREKTQDTGLATLCSAGTDSIAVSQYTVTISASNCTSPQIAVSANGFSATLPANTVPAIGATVSTTTNTQNEDLFGGNGVLRFSY